MSNVVNTPQSSAPVFLSKVGFWAVLTAALALMLVFLQIVGPTFETKPSIGSQIGEIAGDMKRSAWRSFLGLPEPTPEPVPVSMWTYAAMAAPILGVIAVVLSLVSAILRENWHYAVYGTVLGAAAIVFQFFWWVALLVVGVILIVTIIENLGDIFSF